MWLLMTCDFTFVSSNVEPLMARQNLVAKISMPDGRDLLSLDALSLANWIDAVPQLVVDEGDDVTAAFSLALLTKLFEQRLLDVQLLVVLLAILHL